jgi:stage V sporulation protein G
VSITLDDDFAVHDVKVIEGPQRLFVAMPSRKDENGIFRDIVHPITSQARATLENSILDAYRSYLEQPPQIPVRQEPDAQEAPAEETLMV